MKLKKQFLWQKKREEGGCQVLWVGQHCFSDEPTPPQFFSKIGEGGMGDNLSLQKKGGDVPQGQ
jgi:hypothetical protein